MHHGLAILPRELSLALDSSIENDVKLCFPLLFSVHILIDIGNWGLEQHSGLSGLLA